MALMSQTFSTTYGDQILIEGADAIIGTAMLGTAFGTVKNFAVKRTAQTEELMKGSGNLRAKVYTMLGFEGTLEVAFDSTVTAPAIGERITLPLVGVVARVQGGVEVKWEAGKERVLSIPVSSWDSLENAGFFSIDPETQERTLLDLAAPVVTPTAGALAIALAWPAVTAAVSYIVQVSDDAGETWEQLAAPTEGTYNHTPLTAGQTRHYRVRAVNTIGNGPWSDTVNATALAE